MKLPLPGLGCLHYWDVTQGIHDGKRVYVHLCRKCGAEKFVPTEQTKPWPRANRTAKKGTP